MANAMMMERPGAAATGASPAGRPASGPAAPGWVMVPRCTLRFEKCQGGMVLTCDCDDEVARAMTQNLCALLAGGLCSCQAVLNGMPVCCYNLTTGRCKCEATDTGVRVSFTSGDAHCWDMIQACCDCMKALLEAGCTCYVLMNNNPVCCGTRAAESAPAKR